MQIWKSPYMFCMSVPLNTFSDQITICQTSFEIFDVKQIELEQKSKYLNSIRVFPFFHFIFLLKWNKQEIFKRRHEKDQKQSPQAVTLLKKRLCHRCFPVNFAKCLKNTFSNKAPPVAAPERWKIVKPITLRINFLHKLLEIG